LVNKLTLFSMLTVACWVS